MTKLVYIRKPTVPRVCNYCQKNFMGHRSDVKKGKAKFCSISCGVAFRNKSKKLNPKQIFLNNVTIENGQNGCWIYKVGTRYGKIDVNGKNILAHRFSYELFNEKIPDGLYVCHKCDVPMCVNPKHLFLGTAKDNHDDMIRKGRKVFHKGSLSPNAKLSEETVSHIKWFLSNGTTMAKIGRELNIAYYHVMNIKRELAWSHIEPKRPPNY